MLLLFAFVLPVSAQDDCTFGVIEAYYRPDDAVALGACWDRVIFAWDQFQPENADDFDASVIPVSIFDDARTANRQIVGLIKGTPEWASESGSLGAAPDGIDLPFDDRDNHFGAFVTRLVEHYSPLGVHHWIIWNEPDIRPGEGVVEFQGEVEDYFYLLRTAYLAIKAADPEAHVQIAGLTWWFDRNHYRTFYLRRLLQRIYADPEAEANNWYFDGATAHIYITTSSVWQILMDYVDALRDFGMSDKDLWLAEFNASPRRDPQAPLDALFQVSLEQQADFIVQASALALAAGVDKLAVYKLYDNHFIAGESEAWGLVRGDGSLRPAFESYAQVIERLDPSADVNRYSIPQGTLIAFTKPESTLYVVWSDTFTGGEFLIHAGGLEGSVSVYDALGEARVIELVEDAGVPLAVIDAPAAERIDLPWVVVSGAVSLVELPGVPRTVWYRTDGGQVIQMR